MRNLANRWVLVTGAASGIGLSTAQAFARRGANVVLMDVNATLLAQALAGLPQHGGKSLILVGDVASETSVAACRLALESQGIVPDILVNNAGVAFLGGFLETPVDQWRRTLDINVMGIVNMVRAFLPAMQTTPGARRIVNVASAAAYLPAPNMSAYAASKGAVKLLSEVLAMEMAGSNIAVQCVYPGIINTPIVSADKAVGANIDAAQRATLHDYYVKQGCSPDKVGEDIVNAVIANAAQVYTGPLARLGNIVSRLSSTLARRITLQAARTNGYLPASK